MKLFTELSFLDNAIAAERVVKKLVVMNIELRIIWVFRSC